MCVIVHVHARTRDKCVCVCARVNVCVGVRALGEKKSYNRKRMCVDAKNIMYTKTRLCIHSLLVYARLKSAHACARVCAFVFVCVVVSVDVCCAPVHNEESCIKNIPFFVRKKIKVSIRKLACAFTAHARINKSCASVSACLCANDPVRNTGSVLPTKSSRACTATCVYTQTDLCIHAPFVLARAVRAHVRVCVCV